MLLTIATPWFKGAYQTIIQPNTFLTNVPLLYYLKTSVMKTKKEFVGSNDTTFLLLDPVNSLKNKLNFLSQLP